MEKLKKLIEEKKEKGRLKKPRYSVRKLTIGVVSFMIGFFVFMPNTIVKALSSNEMSKVVRSIDVRDASGNINFENNGYTTKKAFSDLQFMPNVLKGDETLKGNEIKFKLLGKQNAPSSGKNWKIRLQIDERIAKYITDIQVDPKGGLVNQSKRNFVRVSDTLGRQTNIWEVNFVRSSGGVFAGAETTDTQVAENGVIRLEKSLEEILNEIGQDKLKSDKLTHRIYLVDSSKENKLIPGIDSTGYFSTFVDENLNMDVSNNNKGEFHKGSVSARYFKPNLNTTDKTGSTGLNGAIVLDHKLTKVRNFSYNLSAQGKPWNLNFKIDPKLVPYVQGIELHKVDGVDNYNYDSSYESGKKVMDLSVERDMNKPNYGVGIVQSNNLNDLVNFGAGTPRPVLVRYVLKLNKPLEDVLAELRERQGVDKGLPFGDDLLFDGWITDNNKKLIEGTYGSGFYYIQDIDADGKPDDKEAEDEQSPFIGIPEIKSVYIGDKKVKASVLLNENAGKGNKAQLINSKGQVISEVENLDAVDENMLPKTIMKEFEFNLDDSKKLGDVGDKITVKIIPSDKRYTAGEQSETTVKEAPLPVEKALDVDKGFDLSKDSEYAKAGIKNNLKMPQKTVFSWKEKPDTSNVGATTGIVLVKVPDREEPFEVEVPINVVKGFEVEVHTPQKQIEGQKVADNTQVISANEEGFTVFDVHDEGIDSGLTIDKNGNLTGTINDLTWGDEESAKDYEEQTITLHAQVRSKDSKTTKTVEVPVKVQRDTDKDGIPDVTDTDDDGDGFTDEVEKAKGTDPKNAKETPLTDITDIAGATLTNKDQTVINGAAISVIEIKPDNKDANVSVDESKLPNGVTFENETQKTIAGTVDVNDWGKNEEEREFKIPVTITNKDGSSKKEEVKIKVQRDTDKDGIPDVTDTDDDGDGFTDEVEKAKGTDPKNANSKPNRPNSGGNSGGSDGGVANSVDRISGNDRVETAIEVSKSSNKKADSVIIANKEKFSDVLTAVPFSSQINAPILFTNLDGIPEKTMNEIIRLGVKNIYINGGSDSVSMNVEKALRDKGYNIIRFAGKNRYETASLIGEKIREKGNKNKVIIASGENFPDALSISSLAVKEKAPILLSSALHLTKETEDILAKWDSPDVTIVGQTNTISKEVEYMLRDGFKLNNEKYEGAKSMTRIGGADRYETSVMVARVSRPDSYLGVYASGEEFSDALVAGTYAADKKAPILLVKKDIVPTSVEKYTSTSKIKRAVIIGGEKTVFNNVLGYLKNILERK